MQDATLHAKSSAVVTSFPLTIAEQSQTTYPLLFLVHDIPINENWNRLLKRSFDVSVSLFLILVLFPLLLPLLVLLIRLDSKGPVFFLQRRGKKHQKFFTCLKLRTMQADKKGQDVAAIYSEEKVTKMGMFLRKLHLDELPQLWNVLLGDMSIVGPRPHMISDNEKFEEMLVGYHLRHQVKPGITGLAQVSGHIGTIRTVNCLQKRIEADVYYINHWSLLLDVKIILKTVQNIFFKN